MRRTLLAAAAAATLPLIGAAPTAAADGLPVPGAYAGSPGVASGGGEHWITLPTRGGTAIARLSADSSTVLRDRALRGQWSVPVVALDGTASGISADGRTLVLIRPRTGFPQRRTHVLVLGARALSVHRRLTLRGDYSFDGISPDGRTAYLTNYTSPRDPTKYAVRTLDLRSGRIVGGPIVDPRNPGEKMHGLPYTRAMSPDGRWAYTLYGGGEETFVHALDTQGRTAACIDLEGLGPDVSALRLRVSADGRRVSVVNPSGAVERVIDARSFAVSGPPRPAAPATRRPAPEPGGGSFPWLVVGLSALAALGAAAALTAAGRRGGRGRPAALGPQQAPPPPR